jgi:hypothetical protein
LIKLKVISKPIEVIVHCPIKGIPQPIRFKVNNKGEEIVIKIDRIIEINEEKLAGNKMYVYRCESTINDRHRVLELKYELATCLWYLFKL